MKNCLVTKLKAVVNNDNLKPLGKINLTVGSRSAFLSQFNIILTNAIAGTISSEDSYLCDANGNNIGSSVSYNANTNTIVYFPAVGGTYVIDNKYTLKSLQINGTSISGIDLADIYVNDALTRLDLGRGGTGDISTFDTKNITRLSLQGDYSGNISAFADSDVHYLTLGSTNIKGDTSTLSENTGFTNITLSCPKITGKMSDFGAMTSLISLSFGGVYGGNQISGSIESFVSAQRAAGRTSATDVALPYVGDGVRTWKDSVIPMGIDAASKVSWTASTITFTHNGQTETINA